MKLWLAAIGIWCFSVMLGSSSEWVPNYVRLFNVLELNVIPTQGIIRSDCQKSSETSNCTDLYLVDLKPFLLKFKTPSIGVGQIIYATRYKCLPSNEIISQVDDIHKPGKIFDIFNVFQTVDLPSSGCSSIEIEAWGPKGAVRHGRVGGRFVIGEATAVQQVKRVSEFFSREVCEIFVFCLLGFFLVSFRLRKSIKEGLCR